MKAEAGRLAVVVDLLKQLNGQAHFTTGPGTLGACLREAVMADLDEDTVESLGEGDYDVIVSIDNPDGALVVMDCRLESAGAEHTAEVALAELSGRHLHELSVRLQTLIERHSPAGKGDIGRVAFRRKAESDRCDILQATQKLKVSAEWLKSSIPCTGYRYEEVGGRKIMRDCYWSQELIELLCRIKEVGVRRADEEYLTRTCCDGDAGWANDIVNALRKPERVSRIDEKFVPRIKARIMSPLFVNEPAPKRKKKGEESDPG